ncbi:MAG: hypothetical protein VW547_11560 [Alphaproteobacteria bacterium]
MITVTIGGGEWTLHSCGARRFGFPPDLAGLTLGRAFIDAARRAMRGPATPITQDVTIDGVRVILTSVEVIATVPGPRVFALAWEPVSPVIKSSTFSRMIDESDADFRYRIRSIVRAESEAPLVALVAAVPEGLDPVGWRAAVLAVAEATSRDENRATRMRAPDTIDEDVIAWLRATIGKPCDLPTWTTRRRMHDAYRRAIAPQGPRPAPFRRKAPGLPVDDGRDG